MKFKQLRKYADYSYQTFADAKKQYDLHVEYNDFNSSTLRVFDYILKLSTNGKGVGTVKGETIAVTLEISRSTVARAIKNLKDAEAIISIKTGSGRVTGGRGANVYAIAPFNSDVNSDDENSNDNQNESKDDNKPVDDKVNDTNVSECENVDTTTKATKLNSNSIQGNRQKSDDAKLNLIFSDFVSHGLTKDKFLSIIADAKQNAHNVTAYVRRSCMNFIDNKQSKAEHYSRKQLDTINNDVSTIDVLKNFLNTQHQHRFKTV
ncbi:HTH domain-containing protein [Brochothrix thermosphacta]|uniref:HTH domain-containing protein n=1 Tax=Brochothrix thermosphacta TaxID=2756 RepID=UPI0039AE9F3E